MKRLVTAICLLLSINTFGQDTVALYAEFPGGTERLDSFVNANLSLKGKAKKIASGKSITLAFLFSPKGDAFALRVRENSIEPKDDKRIEEELLRVIQLSQGIYIWEIPFIRGRKIIFQEDIVFSFDNKGKVTAKMLPNLIPASLLNDDPIAKQSVPTPPPTPPMPIDSSFPESTTENEVLYDASGTMPQFPGGQAAMDLFIKNNFILPDSAIKAKVSGRIYIEYIIDEQGKMKDIKILKDGVGYGCADEVLRVFKLMAEKFIWTPGEQRDKKVSVRMRYPVIIRN